MLPEPALTLSPRLLNSLVRCWKVGVVVVEGDSAVLPVPVVVEVEGAVTSTPAGFRSHSSGQMVTMQLAQLEQQVPQLVMVGLVVLLPSLRQQGTSLSPVVEEKVPVVLRWLPVAVEVGMDSAPGTMRLLPLPVGQEQVAVEQALPV